MIRQEVDILKQQNMYDIRILVYLALETFTRKKPRDGQKIDQHPSGECKFHYYTIPNSDGKKPKDKHRRQKVKRTKRKERKDTQ